eukprot:226717-Pyramimonas_sp.AAC.1
MGQKISLMQHIMIERLLVPQIRAGLSQKTYTESLVDTFIRAYESADLVFLDSQASAALGDMMDCWKTVKALASVRLDVDLKGTEHGMRAPRIDHQFFCRRGRPKTWADVGSPGPVGRHPGQLCSTHSPN